MWEKSCYRSHSTTLGGVSNMNHSLYSRTKISTSLAITCDCSIEWRTSIRATTRTLTLVTHTILSHNWRNVQCSSSILSHNSKDAILSHNLRNATCLPSILRHNLRNAATTPSLRYNPKPCKFNLKLSSVVVTSLPATYNSYPNGIIVLFPQYYNYPLQQPSYNPITNIITQPYDSLITSTHATLI